MMCFQGSLECKDFSQSSEKYNGNQNTFSKKIIWSYSPCILSFNFFPFSLKFIFLNYLILLSLVLRTGKYTNKYFHIWEWADEDICTEVCSCDAVVFSVKTLSWSFFSEVVEDYHRFLNTYSKDNFAITGQK